MSPHVVAIAGFTGMFGRQVTESLLRHDNVRIHGIVRDKSKVATKFQSTDRIKLFEADSGDVESLRAPLRGSNVCVCCYNGPPSLMIGGQRTLIDACIAENVPRYIASDYSFDFRGLRMGEFPFKDFQLKTRDYLEEQEQAGKIKAVHVLNGAFCEVVVSEALGVIDASTDTFSHWATGDEPWDMTSVPDTAAFVALVALDPDATGSIADSVERYVRSINYMLILEQPVKSIREMAEVYEKVYDTKAKMESLGTMDELKSRMIRLRESEPDNIPPWLGLHYNYFTLNGSTLLKDSNLGRYPDFKPENLEGVLRDTKKENLKTALYG